MANHTELTTLVPWQSGPKTRGGLSIVWTCLALIITCTWTTLHLNVPGLYDTPRQQIFRKLKWMLVMFIFPEFVFARAVVELKTALDDYIEMASQGERLRRLGWCVHPSRSARWIQQLLGGFQMPSSAVQEQEAFEETDARSGCAPDASDNINANDESTMRGNPNSSQDFSTSDHPTADGNPTVDDNSTKSGDGLSKEEPGRSTDAEADFYYARTNCEEHEFYKWTLTHTLFANMGGLMSMVGGTYGVLYTGSFLTSGKPGIEQILWENHFTENDIIDKSKGDVFVRVLWLVQIVRLLLDLIARTYEKYPITPFEIITASFATLSFTTVIVQIKKPLDVRKPLHLRKEKGGPLYSDYYRHTLDNLRSFTLHFLRRGLIAEYHTMPRRILNDHYRNDARNEALLLSMLTGSTVIFGLIHCGAWAYAFPSLVEKWIWRAGALAGVVLPLLALIFTLLLNPIWKKLNAERLIRRSDYDDQWKKMIYSQRGHHPNEERADFSYEQRLVENKQKCAESEYRYDEILKRASKASMLFNVVQYTLLALHLLSRVALIVVALISFRSAPKGIYLGTWASFIPTIQ